MILIGVVVVCAGVHHYKDMRANKNNQTYKISCLACVFVYAGVYHYKDMRANKNNQTYKIPCLACAHGYTIRTAGLISKEIDLLITSNTDNALQDNHLNHKNSEKQNNYRS